MSTMREVAKLAGVGLGTVSRALSGNGYVTESKKRKIIEAAEQLHYRLPERFLQSSRQLQNTSVVGVIVPDVSMSFYGEYVKAVDIALSNAGYHMMLMNTLGVQGRVAEMLDLAESGLLNGILINADITQAELSRLEKLPSVSFERLLGKKIPCVASEHKSGGIMAGELLYKNRCMNVLIISGRHITGVYADCRVETCRQYLLDKGVNVRVAEVPMSNISVLSIEDVIHKYMELYPDVDGIFAGDIAAYCCLQNALALNIRVPDHLRIVGYDGDETLRLSHPRLTTIKQDIPLLAKTCADVMIRRMTGKSVYPEYFIPVKILKGGTA